MADYYLLAGGVLLFMAASLLFIWRSSVFKKDKYDFEKLSKSAASKASFKLLDKIGKKAGINNFREVTATVEELIKLGRKSAAVEYLLNNTPLDRDRAEGLVRMFDEKFKRAA